MGSQGLEWGRPPIRHRRPRARAGQLGISVGRHFGKEVCLRDGGEDRKPRMEAVVGETDKEQSERKPWPERRRT